MYTEILVDISYFNQDTKQNSATCQNVENHNVFSQLLRSITLVLLEMISVRDGAFCLHQFDDDLVKSLIESICSH